jgi:uncharacterized protein (TIGR02646 family)
MTPQTRGDEPDILIQFGAKWTKQFVSRRKKNDGAVFFWPKLPLAHRLREKERLNNRLQPILKAQADGCCSFCDKRPIEVESIEHHAPKSRLRDLAYAWSNLFYCCGKCQGRKKEHYHASLLKPDIVGYRFEDYFMWEFKTGALKPNPLAPLDKQRAAKVTICLYGLNHGDHCRIRLHNRKHWLKDKTEPLEDFSYPAFVIATE